MEFEITTDIALIHRTGDYIFDGVIYAFDKGRRKNSAPLKFDASLMFNRKYTGAEKTMLQNFQAECFTVAGILNFRMQEKLKKLAQTILEGKTGEQVSRDEDKVDPQQLFVSRAKELLTQYQYTGIVPPDGHLKTNFRTAVTSAYHGSLWKKLDSAGIYSAIQYKTRKDSKVRDSHKTLDDKIFYKDDPIWEKIFPPNGWNCRCYTTPLTIDELIGKEVEPPVRDSEQEKKIISDARISKEFGRNSGMTNSIYNKWLDSEMEAISFASVFMKAFEFDRSVTKLLEKEDLNKILDETASDYRYIEPTQKNWDKDFPENKVTTGLNEKIAEFKNDLKIEGEQGTFTAFEKLLKLGGKDGRHELMGLIKPTLQYPTIIIKNDRGAIIFIKSFKQENNRIDYAAITYDKGDLVMVSSYRRHIEDILREIKKGEVLYFLAVASKYSDKFSRNTSHPVSAFDELSAKINKPPAKFNEVWAERISKDGIYTSTYRYLSYTPDGVEIITINAEESNETFIDWTDIDKARKGMLINLNNN